VQLGGAQRPMLDEPKTWIPASIAHNSSLCHRRDPFEEPVDQHHGVGAEAPDRGDHVALGRWREGDQGIEGVAGQVGRQRRAHLVGADRWSAEDDCGREGLAHGAASAVGAARWAAYAAWARRPGV
jgi:hypothetical protein